MARTTMSLERTRFILYSSINLKQRFLGRSAPSWTHQEKYKPGCEFALRQRPNGADITKDEGMNCLVQALENAGNPGVDVLINTAGVAINPRNTLDVHIIQKSMDLNAYGPLRVTDSLRTRRLLSVPGAKIALITSKMESMAGNTSGGSYGYRMSKAALNAAGVSLAHDLKGSGIAVTILHPGWVRTRVTFGQGLVDPHESVAGKTVRIEQLNLGNTGAFWGFGGDVIPW